MNIYIKGECIELALFVSRMCNVSHKRVAILTDAYVDAFSYVQCNDLERLSIDYKGIDIYFNNDCLLQNYDVVIFYNCENYISKAGSNRNDLAIWSIGHNSDFTTTPFKELYCKKMMIVKNYSQHPFFDISLQNYPEYEIFHIPYRECDCFEYMNLQYTSVADYEKLSSAMKNLLSSIIEIVKTGNAFSKLRSSKRKKNRSMNLAGVL